MFASLLYAMLRFALDLLIIRRKSEAELRSEVLALRHQFGVLERQVGNYGGRLPTGWSWQLLAGRSSVPARVPSCPRPETLLRWHREVVRRKWAAYRKRPRRVRPGHVERDQLIVQMARENPRWEYRRIEGELLKLGDRCSHITVRTILLRNGIEPAPRRGQRSWRELVREHADHLLAVDFFTVERGSCCMIATPSFPPAFDEIFRSEGVQVIRLPYRAPRANAFAERWVGTARRELVDHHLIFGRRHLDHVLRQFVDHHHVARPHQRLDQKTPGPRPRRSGSAP